MFLLPFSPSSVRDLRAVIVELEQKEESVMRIEKEWLGKEDIFTRSLEKSWLLLVEIDPVLDTDLIYFETWQRRGDNTLSALTGLHQTNSLTHDRMNLRNTVSNFSGGCGSTLGLLVKD